MRKRDTIGLTVLAAAVFLGFVVARISIVQAKWRVATRSDLQALMGPTVAQVPFTIVCNHIVVPVRINDSEAIDVLLDTGMPLEGLILLDRELASQIGLEYSGRIELGGGGADGSTAADVASGATLSIADVALSDQPVMVLRETEFAEDWPASGIIGETIFEYAVEIDYESLTINLYDNVDDMPEDPGEELELTFTMGIPVVEGAVAVDGDDTIPVMLMTDTGVSDGLLLFTYSDRRLNLPENVIEGVNGILGEGLSGDMKGKIGRVAELRLGPYVLENVVAGFPDEDTMGHATMLGQNGFVGNDVFKRFTVVFDYSGRRMFLKPNKRFTEPFEWNMAGLLFGMTRDGHLQVLEVMQASPGLEAGIGPGDVITAIDGHDVRDLDYEEVHRLLTREGEQVKLAVRRDSQIFSLSLTLRRLI
jgi:hypothetical protein